MNSASLRGLRVSFWLWFFFLSHDFRCENSSLPSSSPFHIYQLGFFIHFLQPVLFTWMVCFWVGGQRIPWESNVFVSTQEQLEFHSDNIKQNEQPSLLISSSIFFWTHSFFIFTFSYLGQVDWNVPIHSCCFLIPCYLFWRHLVLSWAYQKYCLYKVRLFFKKKKSNFSYLNLNVKWVVVFLPVLCWVPPFLCFHLLKISCLFILFLSL